MAEEFADHLPAKISSISVQKKNKERYSIFVDGEFLIGVSESTLIEMGLAKGVEMTPLLFRKIQRAEGRFAVKSYMLKLLARRSHARQELYTKALKKEYPKEVINSVLDELEQKGYIDEAEFARQFASDKFKFNRWGPSKIRSHLYQKNIDRKFIKQSIEQAFEEVNLRKTFLHLVLKRKRRFLREEDQYKRKKKIVDHLARKGYRSDTIFNHIDELMEAIADG